MSNFTFRYPASAIAGKHRLTADDIILLRKHMFPSGLTSDDDVRQLLALHRSPIEKCAQWDNWFVEMITAFIVVHCYPQYSLDELNAEWLIALVSRDGVVETAAELELVLHAMEMSAFVPEVLSAFALDQLRIALERKMGAYAEQRNAKRLGIGAGDIEFIHRILRGALVAGKMILGRREIAVLDCIDTAVRGRVNHPAWSALIGSISERTPEGHATATPWLQMLVEDSALSEAA
jgi:hypothetical protein